MAIKKKTDPVAPLHPDFAKVVKAFAKDPHITPPGDGKGFGSSALKINGKIFAMMSSRDKFVVKLPKERVAELVKAGNGRQFSPGPGRVMKEWLEVKAAKSQWNALAKEARDFVQGIAKHIK